MTHIFNDLPLFGPTALERRLGI